MSRDRIHNASYDYARLLAVVGIIWFHAHAPGAAIGYSGLAFFLLLLMLLALPQIVHTRILRHRAPAVLRYAAGRGQRLLVPWLVASAFYGGLKLIEVSRGASLGSEFSKEMWLTGTATHLWFLPFAFAMGIALWPLGRVLRTAPVMIWAGLSLIFTGLALAALAGMQTNTLPAPLAQWAYALPAVLLGVAIGLTRSHPGHMAGLLVLFFCAALSLSWTVGLLQITLAASLLILCTLIYLQPTPLSAAAARASLLIYLIHPGVMTLVVRSGLLPEASTALALTVTVACLCIVAIWETIRHSRSMGGLLTS